MKLWITGCFLALVTVVLVGCIVGGLIERPIPGGPGRPELPPDKLDAMGFKLYWDSHLRDREIANMWLLNYNVYAETKGHLLFKIDGKSGFVDWVYDMGFATEGKPYIFAYDEKDREILNKFNEIFIIAGNYMYCVDEDVGFEVWKAYLRHTPSSPPFASSSHYYYGSWDNRLRAFNKESKLVDWDQVTRGDIVAGGIEKVPAIFFMSGDGTVYCTDASRGTVNWEFKSQGPFSATPFFYKNRLYVGCKDFNIYALRTTDGTMDWRFPCEAEVVDTPVAVDDAVYCRARNNWFYAIDRRKGKEKWRLYNGAKLLLAGRKHAYVLTSAKEIACVDRKDGKVLWKRPFKNMDFFLINHADARTIKKDISDYLIYLGHKNAWFFCIREKDPF